MARRRHPGGADDSVDIRVPRGRGRLCEAPERDLQRNSGICSPHYEKPCPTIGATRWPRTSAWPRGPEPGTTLPRHLKSRHSGASIHP
jgi:hypothetical protein